MADTETTTKAKRTKKADHEFRDASGAKVTNPTEATAYAYTDLDADGEPVGSVVQNIADYPAAIVNALALFGLKTKTINTASQARQAGADELEAIREQAAAFSAGEWTGDRGESMASVALLAAALIRVKDGDWQDENKVAEMVTWLNEQEADQRDAYAKHPKVKEAIARIKAERVLAKAETASDEGLNLDALPI